MRSAVSPYNDRMPSVDEITEALKAVTDPEIGINIVDLGLLYEIQVDEAGSVSVIYSLTSMGCPAGDMIESDIQAAIRALEGVAEVQTEVTFQPPWSPDKMSDFARSALGFF